MLMNNYQLKQMKHLLCYLYENNNYYSQILRKMGSNPFYDDIQMLYDNLPFIKKEDMVELGESILTNVLFNTKIFIDMTSGSSGNVLKCYKTLSERTKLAINVWNKRKKIDRFVSTKNYISLFDKELENLIGKFYNTEPDKLIDSFIKIVSLRPRWLSGPISVFERIALLIKDGLKMNFEELQVIELIGEYASGDTRKLIESAFNCKTVNHYGAQEVWCMAYDCTEQHLHIQENFCFIDYYKQNCNNGEIVVTSFNNYLMPIIKYRIGDVATLLQGDCVCGDNSMQIQLSDGRAEDVIFGTNILGSYLFDQLTWDINREYGNGIYAFRAIQCAKNYFKMYIVKGSNFNENILEIIKNRLILEIGSQIVIEFKYFDNLSFSSSGKIKKFTAYHPVGDNSICIYS